MKKGFTLLELLVVIAVAAILVSIASASYTSAQKKARDARRSSDMHAVQNAAEQYYADNVFYPPNETFGAAYLPAGFPSEPKTGWDAYVYTPIGVAPHAGYYACAKLESPKGNATASDGTGFGTTTTGTHYCVKNLQ